MGVRRRRAEAVSRYRPADGETEGSGVSNWYRGLELSCPLLSDGLCMWYDQRPAVCREHIVTGSELACLGEGSDEDLIDSSRVALVPISIVEALGQLTAGLEGSDVEAVMLPLALPWTEDNLDRAERTWPARVMVERFIEILREMASASSSAFGAS